MQWLIDFVRRSLGLIRQSGGSGAVQIGRVDGNVTITHGVQDDAAYQANLAAVIALKKQVPWPPVRDFIDREFRSRIVESLDKHQLYRLRRYMEAMIENRGARRK